MARWIAQVITSLLLAAIIGLLISGTAGDSDNPTITQLVIPATTTAIPVETTTTVAIPDTTTTTSTTSTSTTTTTAAPASTTTTTTAPPIDEEAVLLASYPWGPSDEAMILQTVLGVAADGWYGGGTRNAHLAELEARGLSTTNVPPVPTTTTAPPTAPTTPPDSGLPDLSYLPSSTLQAAAIAFGAPCLSDGILTDCPASVLANIDAILALLGV
ncbi:MAG: hypothetical protein ACJZ2F_07835 [Acidimicrobiales bacterium]|tara:strand:+ start:3349 stop:3993 length:645 start_codon:yes stop_codon:yes gene_type:complete